MPLGAFTAIEGAARHLWQQDQEDAFASALEAAHAEGIKIAADADAVIGAVQGVEGSTAVVFATKDAMSRQVIISTDVVTGFAPWAVEHGLG